MDHQNRIAAGVPTGGQFAPQRRAEAAVNLPAPEVTMSGTMSFTFTKELEPLPVWPAHLPAPEIAWGLGDTSPDEVYVTMHVDDEAVTVWNNGADSGDSVYAGEEPTGWDNETTDAVIDYGHALRKRLTVAAWSAAYVAVETFEKQITDAVLERAEQS